MDDAGAFRGVGSAELFRALFETAPDAMIVTARGGTILIANAQAERLFGYVPEELHGLSIDVLVPQHRRASHAAHRAAYEATPVQRQMGSALQLHALRRNGSEFPVEIALSPITVGNETHFAAAIRDVSELQRTRRDALRGRYSAYVASFGLKAVENPDFDSLLNASTHLVADAMEVDAVIVFRLTPNRAELYCAASCGIPQSALAQLRVANDARALPGYIVAQRAPVVIADTLSETRFEIISGVRQLGLRSALCVPLFGRDEVIGCMSARTFKPREYSEDDVNFLQSIANVLSTVIERETAEEQLLHSRRLEALGQLTGGVAHDFNNLLMVISGNLQLLDDRVQGDPAQMELARRAAQAAEQGATLTRKLLAFARKQPLHPQPFDLNSLVSEFRLLVQRTLGANLVVRVALDPSVAVVIADPTQVETALLNLAVNARDAMPEGGALTLETRLVSVDEDGAVLLPDLAPGDYAVVSVTDSGTGMSPEVAARAFEPFFTTKESGKGSGLGLSMVYGFARQSGGTAKIYSESGLGTTVKLYLPRPESAVPRPPPPGAAKGLPQGDEVVLVVEDNTAVRNLAVIFLSALGYKVLQVGDAEAALRILEEESRVDLLFTDVVLPGIDGIELAGRARASRPGLRVLYASGYASQSLLDRMPEGERHALLSKPYRREELAFAARRTLDSTPI